jgi:hypothetical protein
MSGLTGLGGCKAPGMNPKPATRPSAPQPPAEQHTGISNRESAAKEEAERQEHPPIDTSSPPPQDAAGRIGELDPAANDGRQTSHKAGSRSIAQKADEARYPDGSMPPTRKVSGAFGKEPQD